MWYLIPLTFNSVIFFFYGKYIEEKIDARVVYFLKITFFIPVLNSLQAISFMLLLLSDIRFWILFLIFKIKCYFIFYRAKRRAMKAMNRMMKTLSEHLKYLESTK